MRNPSQRGVTLIEALVAVPVMAIVVYAAAQMLYTCASVYRTVQNAGELVEKADAAYVNLPARTGILPKIRLAKGILGVEADKLRLNVSDTEIHYYVESDKLICHYPATDARDVIARDVQSVRFGYYYFNGSVMASSAEPDTVNIVSVDLVVQTADRRKNMTLTAAATMRNRQ